MTQYCLAGCGEQVEPGDDFCRTCHEEALREQRDHERFARELEKLRKPLETQRKKMLDKRF